MNQYVQRFFKIFNGYTKISVNSDVTKFGVNFQLLFTVHTYLMSSLCLFSLLTVLSAKSDSDAIVLFTIVNRNIPLELMQIDTSLVN